MLLVTVLAHEIGHELTARFGCSNSGPTEELLADELSTALIARSTEGRLASLHQRMSSVADAMIEAVPEPLRVTVAREGDLRLWVGAQASLPKPIPSYVTLHLSRQRRLLEERSSFESVAAHRCLDAHRLRLATREVEPGRVRTTATALPRREVSELLAITPDGHVWGATGGPVVELRRLDAVAPRSTATLPDELSEVFAFAALSDEVFAVADYKRAWLIRDGAVREIAPVLDATEQLAFAPDGTLYAGYDRDGRWQVVEVTLASTPPRCSIAGRRDGQADTATFFAVLAVGALKDGSVAVLEEDYATNAMLLRVIER